MRVTEQMSWREGQRIVVRTPDRREYQGQFVERRTGRGNQQLIVVRLDTGWLTSYPAAMVHAVAPPPAHT